MAMHVTQSECNGGEVHHSPTLSLVCSEYSTKLSFYRCSQIENKFQFSKEGFDVF